VIGIGLNLQLPSDDAVMANWIGLDEITGQPVARNYLAGLLVNELLATLNIYQTQGLRPFLDCWRQHNIFCGKEIIVHTPTEKITGVMMDISAQGELLLKGADGEIQRFQCGEVSIRADS
jgi:BirA family biotin operon repressor/biotin-[acetyl-CoA-carboxylase] ligase